MTTATAPLRATPVSPVTASVATRAPRLLFVYTWDILRSIFALLAAVAAFSGGIDAKGHTIAISLGEQLFDALSAASYAAVLIILAVLLSRRQRWVRRAQLVLLVASAVLIVVSLAVSAISAGLVAESLIGGAVFLVLDGLAVWSLSRADAALWYVVPGAVPRYVSLTAAFWMASSAAIIVITTLH